MDWLGLAVGVVGVGIGIVALLEAVPKNFQALTTYGGIALVMIGLLMMLVPVFKGTKKFLWLRSQPLPLWAVFAAASQALGIFREDVSQGAKNQGFCDAVIMMAKAGWITVYGEKPGRGDQSRSVAIPQSYFNNHKIWLMPDNGTASTYKEGEVREIIEPTLEGREDRYFNLHVSRNFGKKFIELQHELFRDRQNKSDV